MYTPAPFRNDDPAVLHELIERHAFALLITPHAGEMLLTHLPFRLDPTRGPLGTLEAHLARVNPHARAIEAGAPSTVVFTGPNAYVTPRWYTDPAHNVPTWNYTAVHAHGSPRVITEPDALIAMIGRLTDTHEVGIEPPWAVPEAGAYAVRLLGGVVGFELPIERLEGKFKLSQNRDPEDRRRVRAALAADPAHAEIVGFMDRLVDFED